MENLFKDFFTSYKKRKERTRTNDEFINKEIDFNLLTYIETLENLEKDPLTKSILEEEKFFKNDSEVI